jgi:hypothetical protein
LSEHHDEKPHLPPPSLWPVGFAIGIACVLVGLVVSWIVAGVGGGRWGFSSWCSLKPEFLLD